MSSILRSALAALVAAGFASPFAWSEPATSTPPEAVREAIAASPVPDTPTQVIVGAYINDIQELDFKANNYIVDPYVWFRWRAPRDPEKSLDPLPVALHQGFIDERARRQGACP
jgi:hypothetical protein